MQFRTDLAMENHEQRLCEIQAKTLSGVSAKEYTRNGFLVHHVKVINDEGAMQIEKPVGSYVTLMLDPLIKREEDAFSRCAEAIAFELRELLPSKANSALICGIGNPAVTPDAVGPIAVEHIMVTRHMIERLPRYFGSYRPVSAVSPGVLGMTGIETGEILKGIISRTHPDFIIAVDALAAHDVERLCTTVQVSDTGIIPGSGVGNSRNAITYEELGIPVLAVGVPTVVDAVTLAKKLLWQSGCTEICDNFLSECTDTMMVTPREIDTRVSDVGKLIGYAINLALHDGLSVSDVDMFLS